MSKTDIEEFISKGYITDSFIAASLLSGKLNIYDNIVKAHVQDISLYNKYFNEKEDVANTKNSEDNVKNLKDYIEDSSVSEECATPGNTVGMGNPTPASEDCDGTEPVVVNKKKTVKKKTKKVSEEE